MTFESCTQNLRIINRVNLKLIFKEIAPRVFYYELVLILQAECLCESVACSPFCVPSYHSLIFIWKENIRQLKVPTNFTLRIITAGNNRTSILLLLLYVLLLLLLLLLLLFIVIHLVTNTTMIYCKNTLLSSNRTTGTPEPFPKHNI